MSGVWYIPSGGRARVPFPFRLWLPFRPFSVSNPLCFSSLEDEKKDEWERTLYDALCIAKLFSVLRILDFSWVRVLFNVLSTLLKSLCEKNLGIAEIRARGCRL